MTMSTVTKRVFLSLAPALLLFAACQTTPPDGYRATEPDAAIFATLESWSATCFKKSGAASFKSFLTVDDAPDVEVEGAWSDEFSKFKGQLVTPLGEALVEFELQKHELTSKYKSEVNEKNGAQNVVNLLSELGSTGLRALLCGLTSLDSPPKAFIQGDGSTLGSSLLGNVESLYVLVGKFPLKSGKVESRNSLALAETADRIFASSKASYFTGIFSKEQIGTSEWKGSLLKGNGKLTSVVPQELQFDSTNGKVRFTFADFE